MVKVAQPRSATVESLDSIGLGAERLRFLYRTMVGARLIADRMFALQRQGRAPFAITGQGQEACQVGSAMALRPGRDWFLPYYRDTGVVLVLGMTAREIMLHFLARAEDPNSGGRQMPGHWSSPPLRVVSGSSVVGSQIPHAAGVAYASKLRGEEDVTIVYFGEGATSEGDFHEGLNFAAVHKLPVIFFCENNGYAISEPTWKEMPVKNVADRARAYGFRGEALDGNDAILVYQTTRWAAEECRRGRGPKLIEAKTYRLVPHSTDDDDRRYRSRKELEEWARQDPIQRLHARLLELQVLTEEEAAALRREAEEEVRDAVRYAEAAPEPDPATALDHVYAP